MNTQVAQTIRQQISMHALLACGARQFAGGEDFLSFRVGNYTKKVVHIQLINDTYTVKLLKFNRVTYALQTIERKEGVYCDMLSDIIYSMCNK